MYMSMLNKLKKKGLVATFLAIMSITTFLPTKAFAHDTYFIQSLINNNDYTYIGNVINDSASFFSDESKHFENELGTFDSSGENIIDKNVNEFDLESLKSKKNGDVKEGSDKNAMPLSFPGLEKDDDKGKKINANGEDADRAYYISTTLYSSLNDALKLVYADSKPSNIPDLVTKTNNLLKGGNVNGWTVSYGQTSKDFEIGDSEKDNGIDSSCYVTITKDGISYDYIYKIPKGYKSKAGKVDLSRGASGEFAEDAEFINWGIIAYEAVYAYYCHDFTFSNAGEQAKVGVIEQGMVTVCQSVLSWVRNLLGLYGIDELVFNQGIRGSKAFYNGIFPSQWESRVMIFYFIFLGIAIALIALAIIRILIKRNIATINSSARYDMINGIQKLLIAGFILAFLFPIINMVTKFNALLVQIFYSTTQGSFQDMFINMSSNANVLGAFILQFIYLFISIYLNFTYIMRGIVLALLIASAPLFVIFIALGDNTSKIAETWIREFLANVFLQSIHALMLTFFTAVSVSSRGIEQLIVFGSLIIVTNLFKGLVLGSAGDTALKFGTQATNTAQKMVSGALNSMGRGKSCSGGSNDSSSSQVDNDDVDSNIKQADSSKYAQSFKQHTGDFVKNTGGNILRGAQGFTKLSAGVAMGAMGGDSNATAMSINNGIANVSGAGLKQTKDTLGYGKNVVKDGYGYGKAKINETVDNLFDELSDSVSSDYGDTSDYSEEMNKTGNPLIDGDNSMEKTSSEGSLNNSYNTTPKDGGYSDNGSSKGNTSSEVNETPISINTSNRTGYNNESNPFTNNNSNSTNGTGSNNSNSSYSENSSLSNNGSSNNGSSNNGSSYGGSSYDGSSYGGSSYGGSSYDGSSYDGSSYDGSSYDGSSYDGSSYDGSSYNGSSYDGSSNNGSSYDESNSSNNGGSDIDSSPAYHYNNTNYQQDGGSFESNNEQLESENVNPVPRNNNTNYSNSNNSGFNNENIHNGQRTYDNGMNNNHHNYNNGNNRGNSSSNFNIGESSENVNSYDNYSYLETDYSPKKTARPGSEKEYRERNLNESNYVTEGYIERSVNNEIMGNDNSIAQDVYNMNERE